MKTGNTHCLIPTYLENSDGFNKKKVARSRNFPQLRREEDPRTSVQQLHVVQPDPSRTETPCLEQHCVQSATPLRKCCKSNHEERCTSNFSLKDDSPRIRSTGHDNRLEQTSDNFPSRSSANEALRNAFKSSSQMSRSSIWMDLPTREATETVCERTPPPSVAATLETDHSWFGVTFLTETD
ncbi:hypothetical protein ANCDUO_07378 [Ancylostoma duodenale]|uniref:Uncharacterized protein n=1 Tax=Ancylostoma duodenale TaxID=51022 RepID=A0A0C2GM95_9BILA|nr:hypothetical protein ANCDUO_07378 [Ancylostoma duodenale]